MKRLDTLAALIAIGFSDKEARTYLASLALGPATVVAIAAEAKLTRPSVYLMIESLERRGMMTTYKQGKKSLYRASSPLALRYINAQAQAALTKKERALSGLIDSLGIVANGQQGILVKFLDGYTATPKIQDLALAAKLPTSEVVNLKRVGMTASKPYPGDKRMEIIKKGNYESIVQESEGYEKRRDPKTFASAPGREISGQVWLIDDRIYLRHKISNNDKLEIVNKNIAGTLRSMFGALRDDAATHAKRKL